MAGNGYFDEEPLVAVPKNPPFKFSKKTPQELIEDPDYIKFLENPKTELVVVEGSRRLAAIKILVDSQIRKKFKIHTWPEIKEVVRKDLEKPPVIVYSTREEVLPYLGVRHIVGIKKWESFAKARYVAAMTKKDLNLQNFEQLIGDRSGATKKIYVCYELVQQAKKIGFDTTRAKEYFSYLLLALGQRSIKEFLGLAGNLANHAHANPVPKNKVKNLKQLLLWLFGDEKDKPAIGESRDITNKLTDVLESKEATARLIKTNNIDEALEYTNNEEAMLLKYLAGANKNLKSSLNLIRKHRTLEVKARLKELQELLEKLSKEI